MRDPAISRLATSTDSGPKHTQLRTMLESEITSGAYSPGKFLPSEPELARRFAISRSTVRQALFALEQDGFVERLPGKGTVVREREGGNQPGQLAAFAIVLPEIQSGHYPALVDAFRRGPPVNFIIKSWFAQLATRSASRAILFCS